MSKQGKGKDYEQEQETQEQVATPTNQVVALPVPQQVGTGLAAGHATAHATHIGDRAVPSVPDLSGFRQVGQIQSTPHFPPRLKSRAVSANIDYPTSDPDPSVEHLMVITDGGWGDHVLFSCAARSLRRKYPNLKDFEVFCVFPEALEGCRHLTGLYNLSEMHGYEQHRTWKFHKTNIYGNVDFIHKGWHYAQCFCDCCDCNWDGLEPEYVITKREFDEAKRVAISFSRPIVMLHTQSSVDPRFNQVATFNKNYPVEGWQQVVNQLQQLGFLVLIAGHPSEGYNPQNGQPLYQGQFVKYLNHPQRTDLTPRKVMAMLPFVTAFVESQSHWQHVGAAIGRPGVCLFGHDAPWWTGWSLHTNVYKGPSWIAQKGGKDGLGDKNEADAIAKLNCAPCGRPEGQIGDVCMWEGQQVAWFCGERPCLTSIQPDEIINGVIDLHNAGNGYDFGPDGGQTWGGRRWNWYDDLPGGSLSAIDESKKPKVMERQVRQG